MLRCTSRLQAPLLSATLGPARRHLSTYPTQALARCATSAASRFPGPLFHVEGSQLRQVAMAAKGKSRDSLAETADGEFKRKDSTYRDWIEDGGKYPPECEQWICQSLRSALNRCYVWQCMLHPCRHTVQ